MVFESYHVFIQPAGLVAVGINIALALIDVLTNFPLFFEAVEELPKAASATEFAPALELLLACGRLLLFLHASSKDSADF